MGNGLISHRAEGQCAIPSAVTTSERTRSTVVFGLFPDLPCPFLQSLSSFCFLFILFFIREKKHPGKVRALRHIPMLRTLVLCSALVLKGLWRGLIILNSLIWSGLFFLLCEHGIALAALVFPSGRQESLPEQLFCAEF